MPKQRRLTRSERAKETRDAILETAARLFLRSGIEATSLDRVAAELGLTKGAVYASFPSKAALVEAVAAANSSSKAIFGALLEPGTSLADRLRTFGERLVTSAVSRQVVLLDLEYVIYSARNARWERTARAGFQAELAELAVRFREANLASGDRVPLSEERFLLLLNILGRGLVQELALHPGTLEAQDVTRILRLLTAFTLTNRRRIARSRAGPIRSEDRGKRR
jgi:AcrR family transcriptional regulator